MTGEFLATEYITSLAGNGGSITAGATTLKVADALPPALTVPFRAVIKTPLTARTGEIVRVTAVSGLTWTVVRGQEIPQGAPPAITHLDGDLVGCVLTSVGLSTIIGAAITTLPVIAGTALSAHRAVVQQGDGRVYYADPTNPAHAGLPLWMSLTAASAPGDQLTVQVDGEVVEPTWTWTASGLVFVGAAGVLTQTYTDLGTGSWSRVIGAALDATTVYVSPSGAIVLAA